MAQAGDINKILTEREQAEVFNEILAWRLDGYPRTFYLIK
jgi:hypothetical protein